jgi:membrane protein
MAQEGTLTRVKGLAGRATASFPVRVVRKFLEDDAPTQAVVIAWNALLAIFPIALALAAVGGLILSRAGLSERAIETAVLTMLPQGADAQQSALDAIESLQRQKGVFAVVALLGFLWTASGLFGAMEKAFARVFRTTQRSFLRQKLMSLAMMGLFTVLAVAGVGTSALLPLLDQIPGVPISLTTGSLGVVLQVVIGTISGFLLFFAIYYVVPNRHQRLRGVVPGALVAGAAFEGLALLFPLYIQFNQGINMYGRSFALLFVLLAFFYFLGVITMLGAEINAGIDPPPQEESANLP